MIPDVTHEEYTNEIKRIAKGEPGWSLIPVYTKPWAELARRESAE